MSNERPCVVADAEVVICCPDRGEDRFLRILKIWFHINSFTSRQKRLLRDWRAHHALNKRCHCLEFCGRLIEALGWDASACCYCDFRSSDSENPPKGLVALSSKWGLRPDLRKACAGGLFRPRNIEPVELVVLDGYRPKGYQDRSQGREKGDGSFDIITSGLFPDDPVQAELVLLRSGLRRPVGTRIKRPKRANLPTFSKQGGKR